jgi:hypothetical protein
LNRKIGKRYTLSTQDAEGQGEAIAEVKRVIVGQEQMVVKLLAGLLAQGNTF